MQNSATAWVKSGKKGIYEAQLKYNYINKKDKGTTSRRGQTHNKAKKLKGLNWNIIVTINVLIILYCL